MGGDVKLVYLHNTGDRWEFKTEPHARFDPFLEGLLVIPLYAMRKVIPTRGSGLYHLGYYYEISDEGMWFLRPHFANWIEMSRKRLRRTQQKTPVMRAIATMMEALTFFASSVGAAHNGIVEPASRCISKTTLDGAISVIPSRATSSGVAPAICSIAVLVLMRIPSST